MNRDMPTRTVSLFALLACVVAAVGQPSGTRLKGEAESGRTRKRLTEAQQKLADGKPVADELQDILDQSGNDLVLVKDNQYQPARRLVQQYLATLPDKPLETFRDRIDEPARKLLDAGKKRRDPQPLRELTDRYFVSRPAEEGLLLLGELLFERGDFVAAERAWRALLADGGDGVLAYPKPKTDPAVVKAKLILLRAVGGDRDGATAELDQFKKDHPKASGQLGGVNGVYADTLAKLIAAPPALAPATGGWTGFAGGPTRDGRPDTPLPRFLAGERPRRAAIPRDPTDKEKVPPSAAATAKALAFHPVILNGSAFIADAGRVIQFDLTTGTPRVAFHAAALDLDLDPADLSVPCQQEADYTLTAADGKLFARFGKTALPTGNETGRPTRTLIACLEPKPDAAKLTPGESTFTAKWQAAPPVKEGVHAGWEGAPLVADGRVYAGFVRVENNRLLHAIACYPLAGGEPVWVADVFDTDPRPANAPRHRHEVLTLAGGNVVWCSHAGLTVAVAVTTGKPAWAFRNPPAERPPVVSTRDLCPPVYHDGRVFVAPADGDAVYALDAVTGRRLWATPTPIYVDQLLGVSRGRLIVTTRVTRTGPNSLQNGGVRGYDVATGLDKGPTGWQNHEDGSLSGIGRGVLADNLIFWPTPAGTKIFDPNTGRLARPTNTKLPGNVAVGGGFIVVATATEVWWYQFDGDSMVIPPRGGYPLVGVKDPPSFDPKTKVDTTDRGFDPITAPSLPAPAEEKKAVKLPLAKPLLPISPPKDAPLVLCDGKKLFAHDADDGNQLWETKLGSAAVFDRVAFTTTGQVLALGEMGVAAADAKSGKIAWEYRLPEADPTPRLSAFTFSGNRLIAKVGDHGLIALDLGTGKVAWTRSAADETETYPYASDTAPKFGPHIGALGDRVFVQRGGKCWELGAATGQRRAESVTSLQDWRAPPVIHGRTMILPAADGSLMVTDGDRTAEFFAPAGGEAGRTSTPPVSRVFGPDVFVVVSKNVGDEVYRPFHDLRPVPRLLPTGVDILSADSDDGRIYLPADGKVYALNRETLKESWRFTLPELEGVRWQARVGKTTLIVYPTEAVREESWGAEPSVRSVANHPTALRLLGTAGGLFDAATRYVFPVLILDLTTGKQLQRLDVPTLGSTAAVTPRTDGLLVASTGRAVWLGKK